MYKRENYNKVFRYIKIKNFCNGSNFVFFY